MNPAHRGSVELGSRTGSKIGQRGACPALPFASCDRASPNLNVPIHMMGMGRVLGGVTGDSVKCPVRAYTCPVGGKCKSAGWLDDDGGDVCWFDSPKRDIILMNILKCAIRPS